MAAPLDDFNKIGPSMLLYRPSTTAQKDPKHPSLVVFCTFMGASLKIVAKYAAGYQKLFPHSAILLILSNLKESFTLDSLEAPRTKLATDTILNIKASNPGPVLLHAMSNGGTTAAARITQHLHDTGHPNTIFTHSIVDCAPSHARLRGGVEAMSMQFPFKSPIAKWLAFWTLYITMGTAMFFWCDILRQETMVHRLRRRWNDVGLFDTNAPRLYLFSKKDALIPYEDVREHAEEARAQGWKDVKEELFEKAPHCALILDDPERYWGAIGRLLSG
ncbi:hypothetical protein PRZ48_003137 [Zasmidium cellare]|uniref:Indole-diterpene biosynthesis protein PaxU n=1 Tax=Zasmidium cellare TaxID=395010 RepID=A0ABR0EU82_ZASCE|nr:hypothetical protein PRZ48_003137 [Zasmidium cellare]